MNYTAGASWRGIVLAGGAGTRLYPMTLAASKQLLPIYDKPMVYYPISTLMLGGIREILIISTPEDLPRFEQILGDGSRYGVRFLYQVQEQPEGIAQAFLLGKEFIGSKPVCLILGDNVFYGNHDFFREALQEPSGASVFGYRVAHPERYGVVEFNRKGQVLGIEEKPAAPRSRYAVVGLYCYSPEVVKITENLKPSARGELEITDVNNAYLQRGELRVQLLKRGIAWLDTGTPQSLLDASSFIAAIEARQGMKVACLEEIAYRAGFLNLDEFKTLAEDGQKNDYWGYLRQLAREFEQEG